MQRISRDISQNLSSTYNTRIMSTFDGQCREPPNELNTSCDHIDALCTPSVDNGSIYARPRRNPSINQRQLSEVRIMREAIRNWVCKDPDGTGKGFGEPNLLKHAKDKGHNEFELVRGNDVNTNKNSEALQSHR